MATAPLHLLIPEVTTAEYLRAMLETCETSADMDVWKEDYRDHSHLLSGAECTSLIVKSSVRLFDILGRAQ